MASKKLRNINIISGWIQKAEDDLAFAKDAFSDTEYYDHVCVLAEQAVEKYLKAVIILNQGFLS
ncbi:MAG: HEPN domain-containing protein, partial [Patescibacteria group bacterium]